MRRFLWIALGLVMVAAAVALWVVMQPGEEVLAEPAKLGPIRQYVDEQAVTRLPQVYRVTMPVNGRVEAIPLAEGTEVEKDQVVARIVPRDLELAAEAAQAVADRLQAAIAENADVTVEETTYQQMLQFVESMKAAVEAAQRSVESALAKLDYAEKDLARTQTLAQSSARSQEQLEGAQLRLVEARVEYQQQQLVLRSIQAIKAATDLMPVMVRQYIDRKDLTGAVRAKEHAEALARLRQVLLEQQRGEMRSPVRGVVLRREVSSEGYLPAGQLLLEIGSLDELEVEADVLSTDVVDVAPGDPVEIYGPAIGPQPADGTVARIYPSGFTKVSSLGVEQQRVKVIVRFAPGDLQRLLDHQHLGVGYRVRIQVTTDRRDQAVTVPRSALFRSPRGEWQVYVVRGGVARLQTVEIGLLNDEAAEVLQGVSANELVVVAPETGLADGTKVEPLAP